MCLVIVVPHPGLLMVKLPVLHLPEHLTLQLTLVNRHYLPVSRQEAGTGTSAIPVYIAVLMQLEPASDSAPISAVGGTAGDFLSRVMVRLRHEREPYRSDQTHHLRYDQAMGGTFAQLWFLTRGCTWDRRGSCTMCNYGHASNVTVEAMVEAVAAGLSEIDRPVDELYVSPSGSLLDPIEVPLEARRAIYSLVERFPVGRFSFETRPETVTTEAVEELTASLPGKKIAAGFGLESADPWVLRFCVNKPGAAAGFPLAADLLRRRGIGVYGNVSLGTAFLSPQEAIADAVRSIEWVLDAGADLALLFPMHVKRHTLLHWLYSRGMYEPPSLWSLIEVLARLDRRLLARISISWYRSDYGSNDEIVVSPTTCPRCETEVLAGLDEFRMTSSGEDLDHLLSLSCPCRSVWQTATELTPTAGLPARILATYRSIADDLGLADWWEANASGVVAELRQASPSALDHGTERTS